MVNYPEVTGSNPVTPTCRLVTALRQGRQKRGVAQMAERGKRFAIPCRRGFFLCIYNLNTGHNECLWNYIIADVAGSNPVAPI